MDFFSAGGAGRLLEGEMKLEVVGKKRERLDQECGCIKARKSPGTAACRCRWDCSPWKGDFWSNAQHRNSVSIMTSVLPQWPWQTSKCVRGHFSGSRLRAYSILLGPAFSLLPISLGFQETGSSSAERGSSLLCSQADEKLRRFSICYPSPWKRMGEGGGERRQLLQGCGQFSPPL